MESHDQLVKNKLSLRSTDRWAADAKRAQSANRKSLFHWISYSWQAYVAAEPAEILGAGTDTGSPPADEQFSEAA